MDEACSSQSGFPRLGTSHNEVWIKHVYPYGDRQKLLQFLVCLLQSLPPPHSLAAAPTNPSKAKRGLGRDTTRKRERGWVFVDGNKDV